MAQRAPLEYPHVEKLKRPFTEAEIRDRLESKGGTITWLWLNRIKSVCLVEFKTEAQAADLREHLWDTQWPEKVGLHLQLSFVSRQEADAVTHTTSPAK
ncbi:hypothetical protein T484DRAFT_1771765 [Baffinella frigidus]|nr:hypothetical protein T484DRAFT_1771765 [Cryptophyta sp. CCMP2293]